MFNNKKLRKLEARIDALEKEVSELRYGSTLRYNKTEHGNFLYSHGKITRDPGPGYKVDLRRIIYEVPVQVMVEKIFEHLELEIEYEPGKKESIKFVEPQESEV